ncbi:hypothetical protein CYY_003840 [Polysphondylium violaceum]|uniref:Rhodanese domain-containing protein n=1 Tax=Polysphondylium violaceum TaxID=133409 RepID=A0A8J4V5P1_9MYCE|nr:hypothetical protein CYY_003840 [Polysphondylium violaceum]
MFHRSLGLIVKNTSSKLNRGYCSSSSFDFTGKTVINKKQLQNLIQENKDKKVKDYVLIDVREPHEVEFTSLIPSAVNIPLNNIQESLHHSLPPLNQIHEDDNIIFYCLKGGRSAAAVDIAKRMGFKNSINYPGSYIDWATEDEN